MKTIEQIQAERVSAVSEYADKTAKVIEGAILPHLPDVDLIARADKQLRRVYSYLWALRSLPIMDISFLSAIEDREATITDRRTGKPVTIKTAMPVFAVLPWSMAGGSSEMRGATSGLCVGNDHLSYKRTCFEILGEFGRDLSFDIGVQWSARCPIPPPSVVDRVESVKDRFDFVTIAWEAEWVPTPVKDPLVIGTVLDRHFLIDEYDLTKRERYVRSEFTRKA